MMYGPIRAIAIDDKPTHLLAIGSGLAAVGIPCMSYWYDREKSSLVPDAQRHPYVRLIFCDLNLAELGGTADPKTLASVVVDVLKRVVDPSGGPYMLVFWTEVGSKVDEVRPLILERLEGVPKPLEIRELSKRKFLPLLQAKGNDLDTELQGIFRNLADSLGALAKELSAVVASRPELSVVAGWESRATQAAASTVNEVFRHATTDSEAPSKTAASLSRVLANIARAAAGQKRAEAEPAQSLDAGMVEILTDQLALTVGGAEYLKAVEQAIAADVKAKAKFLKPERMAAALNTFFQIDTQVGNCTTRDRGAVVPGNDLLTEAMLGISHAELLREHFVHPDKRGDAKLPDLEKAVQMVLVEVGADCDHAQAKPRTLRYLVGFQVPLAQRGFLEDKKGRLGHDALLLLGPWGIEDGVLLVVSCRRFFTWQAATPPAGKAKYRVRSSVVNKLLHHYSSLSSRPGIVEFHG